MKNTPTDHKIDQLIEKRWSPLSFSSQPIEEEKIGSLFEAMRWAPSCFNEQPWRIVYATKKNAEQFQKIADLLSPGNDWAKNAYLLVLACAVPNFTYNGKANRHAAYDTGAGMENMFLQAVSMGLIAHQMAGFDVEKAHLDLGIPPEVMPMAIMAIGYAGAAEQLTEEMQTREKSPRSRKQIAEFAFEGSWKI